MTNRKTDPVAEWGREMAELWPALDKAETASFKAKHAGDGPKQRKLESKAEAINARILAVDEIVPHTLARTPEGALTSVIFAVNDLHVCIDCNTTQYLKRAVSALYSAAAVLEREFGLERKEFGGEYYMSHDLDPHQRRADESEAT